MSSGLFRVTFQAYDYWKGTAKSDAHSKGSERVPGNLSNDLRLSPELLTTRHELLLL